MEFICGKRNRTVISLKYQLNLLLQYLDKNQFLLHLFAKMTNSRRLALTVSDVCLKLGCFQSTSTYSALEVSHFMRYINSRPSY